MYLSKHRFCKHLYVCELIVFHLNKVWQANIVQGIIFKYNFI